MNTLYDLPAPAKLNAFLHVVGRREDGYHLLQSVFVLIELHDVIHIERRGDGQISRDDLADRGSPPSLPTEDLSIRAARLLQSHAGVRDGAHISLTKRIPTEAGLGGGSSDAATTLLALNRLWKTRLNRSELSSLGQRLGADVPFFIQGHPAWVEGTGEDITPIRWTPRRYWILKPPVGLSTPTVFQDLSLQRNTRTLDRQVFESLDPEVAEHRVHNDLQPVAERLCPEVGEGLQLMDQAGVRGRMTGSGTALFAAVKEDFIHPKAPAGWFQSLCWSLDTHPLCHWVS